MEFIRSRENGQHTIGKRDLALNFYRESGKTDTYTVREPGKLVLYQDASVLYRDNISRLQSHFTVLHYREKDCIVLLGWPKFYRDWDLG